MQVPRFLSIYRLLRRSTGPIQARTDRRTTTLMEAPMRAIANILLKASLPQSNLTPPPGYHDSPRPLLEAHQETPRHPMPISRYGNSASTAGPRRRRNDPIANPFLRILAESVRYLSQILITPVLIDCPRSPIRRELPRLIPLIFLVVLSGCGNPYSLKISGIEYDKPQVAGHIQFTDPKIYKREALINERRVELVYLKKLLDDSKNEEFSAQISREVELIQSFAGSLGLGFDPGAQLEFQRTREISDVQHRINLTRMEMQLAALEKDAELLRASLAAREEPSEDLPKGAAVTDKLPNAPQAPDVTKLITQLNNLRTFITGRLDVQSNAPRQTSGTSSPIEKFHDREAYRDAIKGAINAHALDELHDIQGNSLFRMQLQATVLPPSKDHLGTLGMLRMEVVPPSPLETGALSGLYQRWLWYAMQRLNQPPRNDEPNSSQRFRQDLRLLGLGAVSGLFSVITMEIPKQRNEAGQVCQGWRPSTIETSLERNIEHCWYLRMPVAPSVGEISSNLYDLVAQSAEQTTKKLNKLAEEQRSNGSGTGQGILRFTKESSCAIPEDDTGNLDLALDFLRLWPLLEHSLRHLANTDLGNSELESHLASEITSVISPGSALRASASRLLNAVARNSHPECRDKVASPWLIEQPTSFQELLTSVLESADHPGNRVSVYDISPTERVQRVSTAARAAEAVTMAASLLGNLPSAGFAGSGNFAFTRSAVGKADALERAPLVVGFVEPGVRGTTIVTPPKDRRGTTQIHDDATSRRPAFGWLLGPRVSLDPKEKALLLEHHLAPYELAVDLSMPGWWPFFDLSVYSVWAPNWRSGNTTAKIYSPTGPRFERKIRIPMRHNAADLQGLTQLLLEGTFGQPMEEPRIREVHPDAVTVCSGAFTVAIEGDGIWRASEVHIGGFRIGEGDVRVLPDMTGVTVTLDPSSLPKTKSPRTEIVVWTHNGKARHEFDVVFADDTRACKELEAPVPADSPVILEVLPSTISACDEDLVFTVTGRNLSSKEQETTGSLGTMPASVRAIEPNDGTAIEVQSRVLDPVRETSGLKSLTLVLRTPFGVVHEEVVVAGSDSCKGGARPKESEQTVTAKAAIQSVLPSSVSGCDKTPTFTILGSNLVDPSSVMFGTVPAKIVEQPAPQENSLEIEIANEDWPTRLVGVDNVDVIVRTEAGIASGTVAIKRGKCNQE